MPVSVPLLLFVKILSATLIVVTLSVVAEKASPRVSGLLAGYPLGTALALFFYGLELGPRFAADAAVYALLGLIATESFVYVYYHLSLRLRRWSVSISSLGAVATFLLMAQLFSHLPPIPLLVMALTVLSMGLGPGKLVIQMNYQKTILMSCLKFQKRLMELKLTQEISINRRKLFSRKIITSRNPVIKKIPHHNFIV